MSETITVQTACRQSQTNAHMHGIYIMNPVMSFSFLFFPMENVQSQVSENVKKVSEVGEGKATQEDAACQKVPVSCKRCFVFEIEGRDVGKSERKRRGEEAVSRSSMEERERRRRRGEASCRPR